MSGKRKGKKDKDVANKDNARKEAKPSREERGYTEPRGKKYTKDDWKQFFQPQGGKDLPQGGKDLVGDEPDFSEEGWARRFPKNKQ